MNDTPNAAPAITAEHVSALTAEIGKLSGIVNTVAQMLAASQPNTILGEAAGAVSDVAQVATGEASGDPAAAQAAEVAAANDVVSRLTAYEKAHSADIANMIHQLWIRIFGA